MPAGPDRVADVSQVRDLADLVRLAALEHPDKLALVEAKGRSLTWAGLEDEVARVASGLTAAGIVAGHRVALVLGNRLEFVTAYLATLRAHAVAVPLNPLGEPGELTRILAECGAKLVIGDERTASLVREAVAGLREEPAPRVVLAGAEPASGERSYDDLRAAPDRPVPPVLDPERLACVLYTAGTSGDARGAMLSHRALLANIEQVAAVRPPMMGGDDVVLGVLPLFHVYGLNAVLGSVLRHRAKLVLVDGFDPDEALDIIDDEACSVVPLVPPVLAYWREDEHLAERLGPVRLVLSGSAQTSAEVLEEFVARTSLPVHQGYGLTEAAPVVTSTLCGSEPGPVRRTLGAALPGVEVEVRDETGRVVHSEDPGQIWVRGANLFSGYWPDGADGPDAEGWWPTGDVGILDASGDLTLVDRLHETVVVSGFTVYPVEVEAVVTEVPEVRAAAVIGVADPESGQAVVAYVVAPGADAARVQEAVRAQCEARLARFKRPARVEVVDALPTTGAGSVHKGRLRHLERRRALGLLEAP